MQRPSDPVVISYSGGASSEWLIEAVLQGLIPRPERLAVVFADTGAEHDWTLEAVARVKERCAAAGIPWLEGCHRETLEAHLLAIPAGATRAEHPPLYVAKDGGGRGRIGHRCTATFKTSVIRRTVAAWLAAEGLPKRVTAWIGYSHDEQHRAVKTASRQDVAWEALDFPAIRLGRRREQQRAELERWTGSRPPRFSMCIFCPFKDPGRWQQTSEADLRRAYAVDEAIRDLDRLGITEGDCYLTDRLIPIATLIRKGDPQPSLPGLEAYCDAGRCFL